MNSVCAINLLVDGESKACDNTHMHHTLVTLIAHSKTTYHNDDDENDIARKWNKHSK